MGYSTGDLSSVQHWKAILEFGYALYTSHVELLRAIAHVKAFHSGITDDEAFCALADSDGIVDEACGKLSDSNYRSEIACMCAIIDVKSICQIQKSNFQKPKQKQETSCKNSISENTQTNTFNRVIDSIFDIETESKVTEVIAVPEIDPTTGKFFLHDVRSALTDQFDGKHYLARIHSKYPHTNTSSFSEQEIKLKKSSEIATPLNILTKMNSPQKKKVFRVNDVIDQSIESMNIVGKAETVTLIDNWGKDHISSSLKTYRKPKVLDAICRNAK